MIKVIVETSGAQKCSLFTINDSNQLVISLHREGREKEGKRRRGRRRRRKGRRRGERAMKEKGEHSLSYISNFL
jgi:hypothetical protein